jgi:hypothetical protein
MQILRTVLIPDEAQAADGAPSFDLPVNPLSVILLTIKALNENAVITNYRYITALLSMVTDIRVTYRGASIIQGSALDLAVLMARMTGWAPWQGNAVETDNDVRFITIPLCFGRVPYDPKECFPATRRGDLVMALATDVALVGHDNLVIQAETIEILEAQPTQFTKVTTTSKIQNAIIEHDIELPIGNDLLGILLRDASPPQAAAYTAQFGKVAVEVDNVETVYAEANWESLHGELLRRAGALYSMQGHTHSVFAAGAGREFTLEQGQGDAGASYLDNYAYLDFDPLGDTSYALKTAGAARVNLRVTTEVASATAMRVMPIELVPVSGAPGGAA